MEYTIQLPIERARILEGFKVLSKNVKDRENLNRIEFTLFDTTMQAVATDSYRLVKYTFTNVLEQPVNTPLVTLVSLSQLMDALAAHRKARKLELTFEDHGTKGLIVRSSEAPAWQLDHSTEHYPNWAHLMGNEGTDPAVMLGPDDEITPWFEYDGALPAFAAEYLGDAAKLTGPTQTIRNQFDRPMQMLSSSINRYDGLTPWHWVTRTKGIANTVWLDYFLMPVRTNKHTRYQQINREQEATRDLT